jgi:hypothetical protein
LGSQLWTRHVSLTFPPGNRQRRFCFSHSVTSLSGVSICHRLTHPQNHFPWKFNYVGFVTAKFQTLTIYPLGGRVFRKKVINFLNLNIFTKGKRRGIRFKSPKIHLGALFFTF